jgi:hypothetical protein
MKPVEAGDSSALVIDAATTAASLAATGAFAMALSIWPLPRAVLYARKPACDNNDENRLAPSQHHSTRHAHPG